MEKYWILSFDINRYDVHSLFRDNGYCLWNQRRDFQVGDIVYLYESKPVSKIVYKAVVEEINVKRDTPENENGFYKRDYNKEFAFKLRYVAANTSNRLQYKELMEKFDITGMALLNIPQITSEDAIRFFEDVFAGKVEDIPATPTKEEVYQPLESGTMLEHIKHKMDFCGIRDSHLAKLTGISASSIGRARKGEPIKADCILAILDALGLEFIECGKEDRIYRPSEIVAVIKDRIIGSGLRTNEIATLAETSPSVISHLKNDGVTPKLEVLEKLLSHFNFKIALANIHTT